MTESSMTMRWSFLSMPSSERCRLSLSSTFLGLARQFRSFTHEASFTSPEACMPKRASPMNAAVGFEKWGGILPGNRRSCLCALNAIVLSYTALASLFVS